MQPHQSAGSSSGRPTTPRTLEANLPLPDAFANRHPTSPIRFATSTNAFGLSASPASASASSSSSQRDHFTPGLLAVETSPPSAAGGAGGKARMRRPSMLSLAAPLSFGGEGEVQEDGAENGPGPPESGRDGFKESVGEVYGSAEASTARSRLTSQPIGSNPFAPSPAPPPPLGQPVPRWGASGFLRQRQHSGTNLAFEGLTTSTPPIPNTDKMQEATHPDFETDAGMTSPIEADMEETPRSPLRWMPSHLQGASARRKGKARLDDTLGSSSTPESHRPPFTGRPLPASLVATLMSESSPLEHEMQSEARLQRLITSHPRALPFTPRTSRSSRGRFPEMVGDDEDDEDEFPIKRAIWASRAWTRRESSSDSDSDDMPMVEETAGEGVNAAFAAGMDMDRTGSMGASGSGAHEASWPPGPGSIGVGATGGLHESGRSTPVSGLMQGAMSGVGGGNGVASRHPTPPSASNPWDRSRATRISFSGAGSGLVPSPGTGFGLPSAFGSLGMGTGTPMGSPTVERAELAASPSAASVLSSASPSLMQYRESTGGSAAVRPGKRKAAASEDRFDPYKRPRGSSPSFSYGLPMSPSRSTPAVPIPASPGYSLYSSMLAAQNNGAGSSSSNGVYGGLGGGGGGGGIGREQINLRQKGGSHPYTRPMSSRSRQASPALSIGSASGVLSSSLGTGGSNGRGSFSLGSGLGGPFLPTGLGSAGVGGGAGAREGPGGAPAQLGGLGLLSLAGRGEEVEMIREEGEGEGDGEGEEGGVEGEGDGEGPRGESGERSEIESGRARSLRPGESMSRTDSGRESAMEED